jgi:hypothetical protein
VSLFAASMTANVNAVAGLRAGRMPPGAVADTPDAQASGMYARGPAEPVAVEVGQHPRPQLGFVRADLKAVPIGATERDAVAREYVPRHRVHVESLARRGSEGLSQEPFDVRQPPGLGCLVCI